MVRTNNRVESSHSHTHCLFMFRLPPSQRNKSCGLIFLVYGVIQLLQYVGILPSGFLPYNDALYGLVGACLFSFYLAYHTKLIVAGKHTKYQMNEKDYVFGASKYCWVRRRDKASIESTA